VRVGGVRADGVRAGGQECDGGKIGSGGRWDEGWLVGWCFCLSLFYRLPCSFLSLSFSIISSITILPPHTPIPPAPSHLFQHLTPCASIPLPCLALPVFRLSSSFASLLTHIDTRLNIDPRYSSSSHHMQQASQLIRKSTTIRLVADMQGQVGRMRQLTEENAKMAEASSPVHRILLRYHMMCCHTM
jgi:hypothetical protein